VTFGFNQSVASSVGADDFAVSGPGGAVPFGFANDPTTNTATLSFGSILPDGDYTARAVAAGITNGGGTPMPADHVLDFFFLNGDANHDRKVDFNDLVVLAQNYNTTGKTFSQGNFDYDPGGNVDFDDLVILAQRYNTALLPAPPAPAPTVRARAVTPATSVFSTAPPHKPAAAKPRPAHRPSGRY
jgi:hypothetical protein